MLQRWQLTIGMWLLWTTLPFFNVRLTEPVWRAVERAQLSRLLCSILVLEWASMVLPTPDLTDPSYWGQRQRGLGNQVFDPPEWLPLVSAHLERYRGARFLELGCSPGHVSAGIVPRFAFRPEGVDFSPEAHLYLDAMASVGCTTAILHRADLRTFSPTEPFAVVSSFGLVEHFENFAEILDHHDRVLAPGGLCLVAVPNFHGVQWLYHRLFDAPDLRRHNLDAMRPEVFQEFAQRHQHKVLTLQYFGRLRFWNVDLEGPRYRVVARRIASRLARELAWRLGHRLPAGHPILAPWLVYLGQKPTTGLPHP
jgi:SAM-dependent methyltransferase